MLLLEPAQRLGAILVERGIAGRRKPTPAAAAPTPAAPAPGIGGARVVPPARPLLAPGADAAAEDEEQQQCHPERPEDPEPEHGRSDPARLAVLVHLRSDHHESLRVNVKHI